MVIFGSKEAARQVVTDLAGTLKLNTKSVVGKVENQPNLGILCGTLEQGHLVFLRVRAKWH